MATTTATAKALRTTELPQRLTPRALYATNIGSGNTDNPPGNTDKPPGNTDKPTSNTDEPLANTDNRAGSTDDRQTLTDIAPVVIVVRSSVLLAASSERRFPNAVMLLRLSVTPWEMTEAIAPHPVSPDC